MRTRLLILLGVGAALALGGAALAQQPAPSPAPAAPSPPPDYGTPITNEQAKAVAAAERQGRSDAERNQKTSSHGPVSTSGLGSGRHDVTTALVVPS